MADDKWRKAQFAWENKKKDMNKLAKEVPIPCSPAVQCATATANATLRHTTGIHQHSRHATIAAPFA